VAVLKTYKNSQRRVQEISSIELVTELEVDPLRVVDV
jgi:hypothetical protein